MCLLLSRRREDVHARRYPLWGDGDSGCMSVTLTQMACLSTDRSSPVLLQIKPTVVLTPPRLDLDSQNQNQNLAQEDGNDNLDSRLTLLFEFQTILTACNNK